MKKDNAARSSSESGSKTSDRSRKKEFQYAYIIEAVLLLVLMGGGTIFTLNYLKRDVPKSRRIVPRPIVRIPNLVEAETMPVLGKSRDFMFRIQDMTPYQDGTWSNNLQYFAADTRPGDWVDLALPDKPGRWRLAVFLTKSFDYGIVHVKVNGKVVGPDLDLYSGGPVLATGAVFLGEVTLKPKDNVLRLEVVGANSRITPPRYFFGFDGFRLDAPAK
jgi:hypothetical protein